VLFSVCHKKWILKLLIFITVFLNTEFVILNEVENLSHPVILTKARIQYVARFHRSRVWSNTVSPRFRGNQQLSIYLTKVTLLVRDISLPRRVTKYLPPENGDRSRLQRCSPATTDPRSTVCNNLPETSVNSMFSFW
jgi:hypothetical protein